MKCPVCEDTQLVIADRQSIEIDFCPSCRGVWLDRGELDKLIERSAAALAPSPAPVQQSAPQPHGHRSDDRYSGGYGYGYQKRPKSWLSEIFD